MDWAVGPVVGSKCQPPSRYRTCGIETGSTATTTGSHPGPGTAHGVIQAVNTYEHHEGIVRGASRADCNMMRTVTGDFGKIDRTTIQLLEQALA